MLGFAYTLKKFRGNNFLLILRNALIEKCLARGDYPTLNSNFSGFNNFFIGLDFIGRSQIICIH